MSIRRTLATSTRVIAQLKHDRRTVALIFVVPVLLMGLLAWIFEASPLAFNRLAPPLLALFPFVIMFLITSITMLRERSSGTLERLLAMPVGRLDILAGYAISFGLMAIVQALLASTASIYLFGLSIAGSPILLIIIALADALLGVGLGLLASAFARTEFQAVQFMPAFVLPQTLLCGLVVPLAQLPTALHYIANVLPLTYAVQAMQKVSTEIELSGQTVRDLGVVLGFALLSVVLASVTLRRQTR